ncbi:MAG TPA: cytochrome c biogenesis protein CcsA [Chthoniobacterales bacterium]|nr:cytochrome c biogenesis protein CcsA [Chthoniobacterales bacterium]
MKRFFPWLALVLGVLWVGASVAPPKTDSGGVDLMGFGRIPVLVGGRVKPLDTVARNSLLILQGRERVSSPEINEPFVASPAEWLLDVCFRPEKADTYPTFAIDNTELLSALGKSDDDLAINYNSTPKKILAVFGFLPSRQRRFAFHDLAPFLKQIDEQGDQSDKLESVQRSAYQTAVLNLRNALLLYQRLKNSLRPDDAQDFSKELAAYVAAIPSAAEAASHRQKNEPFDKATLEAVAAFAERYDNLANMAYMLTVPAAQGAQWQSIGGALAEAFRTGEIHPVVSAYATLGDAYRAGDQQKFNQQAAWIRDWFARQQPTATKRSAFEYFFNHLDPFTHSMMLYVLAFLLACFSWLGWNRPLNRTAFYLLLLALVVHTFGLGARMYLQERPPVTNLYSSAIFIGWGAVIVALVLERIFRDGIGAVCAGAIGFVTLIIAHHLAGSGDTLEMLQAVLDTNIWLATHVVVITTGYAAMFLAGMLAMIYIIRGVFTRSLKKETADSLSRMTYGVVCFATLFSFVGTVLGGIWADQSWGRFWGWDPKENGAVLIVLWCAIILHARWGGFIRQRGLMTMAIFGNIVTSFSWFGVNMLGVGLHSYGFMQKAFPWLVGFMITQVALMAVAAMPLERWRSFRIAPGAPRRKRESDDLKFVPPGLVVETTKE